MSSHFRHSSLVLIVLVLVQVSLCVAFWWVDHFNHERAVERTVKAAGRIEFLDEKGKKIGELEGESLRKLLEGFHVHDASKAWDWDGEGPLKLQFINSSQAGDRLWVLPMGTCFVPRGWWEKVREAVRK